MAATNIKRSMSMGNGDMKSVNSSSHSGSRLSVSSMRHSVSFPTAIPLTSVKKLEAGDIVEILEKGIAFVSGGHDRAGNLLITIPSRDLSADFGFDEVTSTLTYLVSIPRFGQPQRRSFITIIIDAQGSLWNKLKMVIRSIQHCLGHRVERVLVVKPDYSQDKDPTIVEFKKTDKPYMNFQVRFISRQKLQKYVDNGQLTSHFGGSLPYNHKHWLTVRLNYENFIKETRAVIRHLNTIYFRMSGFSYLQHPDDTEITLHKFQNLYDTAMDPSGRIEVIGKSIIDQLYKDADSGFTKVLEVQQNADLLHVKHEITKLLESVTTNRLKLTDLWFRLREGLAQKMETRNFEATVQKVVDWLLGPGEKLLAAHLQIGHNFLEADEQRKLHEQVELHCTETLAMYAEARHVADEMMRENPEICSDIAAQKEYMESVCRNFASRIERRRNLLITSVRFHRTVQELFQKLADMDETLPAPLTAEEWHDPEAAVQRLDAAFDNINALRDQLFQDGNRLMDLMAIPVKNAFGKEVIFNHTNDIMHIKSVQSKTVNRLVTTEERRDLRKLRLKQILQLSTCERDAQQAIVWILELSALMVYTHIQVGHNLEDAYLIWEEHRKFEETAKGTYEYGKHLLQTALAIRRSSKCPQDPNTEIGQRLFHAWKTFLMGSSERSMRLKVCMTFFRNSAELIERFNQLIASIGTEIAQTTPSRLPLMIRRYRTVRTKLAKDMREAINIGQMLLERMGLPVIPEYKSEGKNLRDENAAQQIKETIETMEEKSEQLNALVTEGEKSRSLEKQPVDTPKSTTVPSTSDDWTSLALSMPEEWHTCPSSITSADEDKSADEFFSCLDSSSDCSRRPSGVTTSTVQRSPAIPDTISNVRKSPIRIGPAIPGTTWKETSSITSLMKETKISSSSKVPGQTIMSISEQKLSEQWRHTPETSTHSKDELSSFERIEEKSPSTLKLQESKSSPSPTPVLDETPVQDEKPKVTSDKNDLGTQVISNTDTATVKLETLLTEEELKSNPLLKHINESKEWLQLKILEMEPDLSKIGTNLEEAQEYQQQHEDVLRKLQV